MGGGEVQEMRYCYWEIKNIKATEVLLHKHSTVQKLMLSFMANSVIFVSMRTVK